MLSHLILSGTSFDIKQGIITQDRRTLYLRDAIFIKARVMSDLHTLFSPFDLPNGTRLKNRLIKSAMSDMLGDGRGNPTPEQRHLYATWAEGGIAAAIVGEVQGSPHAPEAAGNLVLDKASDQDAFRALAQAGRANGSALWLQLGHAGALTPPHLGDPAGPSALNLPGLTARAMTLPEIREIPATLAETAARAECLGFGGVQIHAAHGFLLSQFLSPLFNHRSDAYGGSLTRRMRLLVDCVDAVRARVRPDFTVALKLNSSDGLTGGLDEAGALQVISTLDKSGLDLIDISGGTYFPGAPASSDRATSGPYFVGFAGAAREKTRIPLMATGGFKRRAEALTAIASGAVDMVGLARSLAINPTLANDWKDGADGPTFPKLSNGPPGGVTAWYTMALRAWAHGTPQDTTLDVAAARDQLAIVQAEKTKMWRQAFVAPGSRPPLAPPDTRAT